MKTGAPRFLRRPSWFAAVGILALVLTACTGRGGGQLPPDNVAFNASASFGFTFSCQNGNLRIQLDYTDHGTNPAGGPFSIHGIVDEVDPVLESEICIGKNPPPPPENQLIFLGRYYPTSSPPALFPSTCPTGQDSSSPLCRFEVIVQDNDGSLSPSPGDFFSIKLSSVTALTSELDPLAVFYARAGYLDSGNLTVD